MTGTGNDSKSFRNVIVFFDDRRSDLAITKVFFSLKNCLFKIRMLEQFQLSAFLLPAKQLRLTASRAAQNQTGTMDSRKHANGAMSFHPCRGAQPMRPAWP